jgi:protein-S-isoprenylcysteine O-methyltransferase Ste14
VSILVCTIALIIIPASLHKRSGKIRVVRSRKGSLDLVLLALTSFGFFLPLVWVATPVLAFADYPLRPVLFTAGILCLALGLWLHYRSHADLGTNWSITLELQERHQLVTHGIYLRVRHPMYLALLLYSSGQALVLPNWVAGPSYLVACAILIAVRVGPEERMMREEFGKDYETYAARTNRLLPGLW